MLAVCPSREQLPTVAVSISNSCAQLIPKEFKVPTCDLLDIAFEPLILNRPSKFIFLLNVVKYLMPLGFVE